MKLELLVPLDSWLFVELAPIPRAAFGAHGLFLLGMSKGRNEFLGSEARVPCTSQFFQTALKDCRRTFPNSTCLSAPHGVTVPRAVMKTRLTPQRPHVFPCGS